MVRLISWIAPCGLLMAAACSSGTSSVPHNPARLLDGGPPRYAHLFDSGRPEWRLEADYVRLQRYPFMVIWEVSQYPPGTEPTPEQRRAADDLVERCFDAAKRHGWFEYEKGLADGYEALPGDLQHYRKNELLFDDAILDPDRPEVLMYYDTPEGQKLAGFMFQMGSRFERGPQIGGPLTVWHYHVWTSPRCVDERTGVSTGFIRPGGSCDEGLLPFHRSYEMMHVWLIDRPHGPFSSGMTVPQPELAAALAKRKKERGF